METANSIWLTILILISAILYSAVGHAGASGYLSAMALFGIEPNIMKPTALILNIIVAIIASWKFYRAGMYSWNVLLPFALPAIPFAYYGGAITLPGQFYKPIVGAILLISAIKFFIETKSFEKEDVNKIPIWQAVLIGAGIGFLSGLTGVGGGIFLAPLLLFFRWAETKQTSGICAMFILANSIAGLAGQITKIPELPNVIWLWAFVVIIGGYIGAEFGSRKLNNPTIRKLLAVVLLIAGFKMIFAV